MKLKHLLCVLLTVLVVLPLLTITAFATEREIVSPNTISRSVANAVIVNSGSTTKTVRSTHRKYLEYFE